MINGKQSWANGQSVRVGFLTLVVRAAVTTPGDSLPDTYFLSNKDGTKFYEFTPYQGVRSVDLDYVEHTLEQYRQALVENAAAHAASAATRARANAIFGAV